ncbi:hypothetical protein MC885_009807, partial [Smutsia gigantea]
RYQATTGKGKYPEQPPYLDNKLKSEQARLKSCSSAQRLSCSQARNLKIGYFSQHHVEQLDLNVSAVELLAHRFPGRPEEEYRHQLGRYGISGELAVRPVASLSGGQKSRVAFAQMTMPCPNFYILDEPTNHLDMETIEALGRALNSFRGGVILVSHDERFIRLSFFRLTTAAV